MNYNVESIPLFDKQAKRLAKKYPSLKNDLADFFESLASNPEQGTALGGGFYKIRLSITSKGRGKSGGGIVITYVKVTAVTVYLTSIYDKADKEAISDKELRLIFNMIP